MLDDVGLKDICLNDLKYNWCSRLAGDERVLLLKPQGSWSVFALQRFGIAARSLKEMGYTEEAINAKVLKWCRLVFETFCKYVSSIEFPSFEQ